LLFDFPTICRDYHGDLERGVIPRFASGARESRPSCPR
jgi:hypothetical protein